jgi:aspartate racemase
MKRIGLLGGMSWESSALYYSLINEQVRDRLGGLHSASCIMSSVDFADIERFQHQGDWAAAGELLAAEARRLESAGAEVLVLCTNTMDKVAGTIEAAVSIPFLHLADVAAKAVLATGINTVGLLGTRFTMEESSTPSAWPCTGWQSSLPTQRTGP